MSEGWQNWQEIERDLKMSNGMLEEETLLNSKQVMSYLKIGRTTLERLIREGKLKGCKVGSTWRFYRRDVRKLLMSQEYAKEETSRDGNG